jgi:hypothetical protein
MEGSMTANIIDVTVDLASDLAVDLVHRTCGVAPKFALSAFGCGVAATAARGGLSLREALDIVAAQARVTNRLMESESC